VTALVDLAPHGASATDGEIAAIDVESGRLGAWAWLRNSVQGGSYHVDLVQGPDTSLRAMHARVRNGNIPWSLTNPQGPILKKSHVMRRALPAAIALSIATAGVPHPALADDAASAAVAMTRLNASTLCKTDPSSDLGASDQKVFSEERHRRIVSKWTKSTNDTSGGE